MAATLWLEEGEKAARHLRTLSGVGLLSTRAGGYGIHDLMHDLARELLTAPEAPARSGDIPGFGLTLQGATQRFLERYRAKTTGNLWHTLPDDGYIHDHLVRHFEQAGWDSELEGLLWEESSHGHCGWYEARERLGQMKGFLADVDRVWTHADRLCAGAVDEELRAKAIGLQLHCALIVASINSLSAGIPTRVLAGAVRCGILALPSALTLARQHSELDARFNASWALVDAVQQSDQRNVLGEALRAARGIDDELLRDHALAAVAERLPAEEALAVARGIDAAWSRGRALAAVAKRLPPDEALAVARGIDHAGWRANALAAVAERLPAEGRPYTLAEALVVARGIDDLEWRAKALAAVAQRLPEEDQPGVLGEALIAARSTDDAESRAEALTEVAERLPAEEALAMVRGIDVAKSRAEALAEVAERLPAEDRPGVLAEALSVAQSAQGEKFCLGPWPGGWSLLLVRARVLAAVAARLPAEEALAVARGIDDEVPRAEALAAVADRLPAEDRRGVLAEALSGARGIGQVRARASALAVVAKRLPAAEQPPVFEEALAQSRAA